MPVCESASTSRTLRSFFVSATMFREVHTNTLTGESFVLTANSSFHEIKATQVEGSTVRVHPSRVRPTVRDHRFVGSSRPS